MNALFKLVLSSILAKRVKFFYLHPRLGGGAQCAILIAKGSNLRRCMLDRGRAQWPEHRKLEWKKLQARPA